MWGQSETCIPDLTNVMTYPKAVLEARIQGQVRTTVQLALATGRIQINSWDYPALRDSLEEVLRSTTFGSGCPNEELTLRFSFELSQQPDANSKAVIRRLSESSYLVICHLEPWETNYCPMPISRHQDRVLRRKLSLVSKLKVW